MSVPYYPGIVITPNIGLSLIGADDVVAQNFILIDAAIGSGGGTVTSVFGRTGAVMAITGDYTVAQITGAAPTASPTFTGIPAAPTAAPGTNTTQIATTAFVTAAVAGGGLVTSVFGRTGAVVATTNDYTIAQINGLGTGVATFLGTPTSANLASAVTDETGSGALVFATSPTLVTPALGTPSSGVLSSCTGYAVASLTGLGTNVATLLSGASSGTGGPAGTISPTFTSVPAAPTAAPGTNTTQLATTAFVTAAVSAGGVVSSVFTRTGAVVAATNDYTIAQIGGLGTNVATLLSGTSSGTGGPAGTIAPTFTGTVIAAAITASGVVSSTNALQGAVIRSGTANPATTGIVRLANADTVTFRNNANSADIVGLSKSSADVVQLGAAAISSAALGPFSGKRLSVTQATTLAGTDFTLGAGWGTTATIAITVSTSKDQASVVTVTSSGTGQTANPTLLLTFKDGTFTNTPVLLAHNTGGTGTIANVTVSARSATSYTFVYNGTAGAGSTYEFTIIGLGT